jgi:hypothetical protein
VTHAFVIWMPVLFLLVAVEPLIPEKRTSIVVPCLSVWAVLIQGELRDDDEANTSER